MAGRCMAFGNIKNVLDKKVQIEQRQRSLEAKREAARPAGWDTRHKVKKPMRMETVEMFKAPTAAVKRNSNASQPPISKPAQRQNER